MWKLERGGKKKLATEAHASAQFGELHLLRECHGPHHVAGQQDDCVVMNEHHVPLYLQRSPCWDAKQSDWREGVSKLPKWKKRCLGELQAARVSESHL